MPFDFRNIVAKYSQNIIIEEETGGYYDHQDGGKFKATTKIRQAQAAVFNLSTRDIRGYTMQYGEGGTFTRDDVRIYIHENIAIGAKVTYKDSIFTVTSEINHSDYAHGLRFYIARKADKRGFADSDKKGGDYGEYGEH